MKFYFPGGGHISAREVSVSGVPCMKVTTVDGFSSDPRDPVHMVLCSVGFIYEPSDGTKLKKHHQNGPSVSYPNNDVLGLWCFNTRIEDVIPKLVFREIIEHIRNSMPWEGIEEVVI